MEASGAGVAPPSSLAASAVASEVYQEKDQTMLDFNDCPDQLPKQAEQNFDLCVGFGYSSSTRKYKAVRFFNSELLQTAAKTHKQRFSEDKANIKAVTPCYRRRYPGDVSLTCQCFSTAAYRSFLNRLHQIRGPQNSSMPQGLTRNFF